MKNLLSIILVCLSIACSANGQIAKDSLKATSPEKSVSTKNEDITKPDPVIEEKAPDLPLENNIPKTVKEKTKNVVSDSTKASKKEIIKKDTSKIASTKSTSKPLTHNQWNALLKKHVTKEGNVNYKGFKEDIKALKYYLYLLRNNIPTNDWSQKDKLAYWLNAYNAYTVKLIIDNYPIKSIKDIKDPWDYRFFRLGKKWYTLNDIEHKILRKMGDPRIHFGINCASFSCPPLHNKAFTSQNVSQELENLSIAFVNDTKRNTISTNHVKLSKIFSWFAKDFKKNGSLIDFLNKYSKTPINRNAKKSFRDYDWTLNE